MLGWGGGKPEAGFQPEEELAGFIRPAPGQMGRETVMVGDRQDHGKTCPHLMLHLSLNFSQHLLSLLRNSSVVIWGQVVEPNLLAFIQHTPAGHDRACLQS